MTALRQAAPKLAAVLALALLAGCAAWMPGVPGHEPPSAGRYNPISGETNSSGR